MKILTALTTLFLATTIAPHLSAAEPKKPTKSWGLADSGARENGNVALQIQGPAARRIFQSLTSMSVTESQDTIEELTIIQRHGFGISCELQKNQFKYYTTEKYRCVLQVTPDGETLGFGTDPGGMVMN